jgi:hypothetical protein
LIFSTFNFLIWLFGYIQQTKNDADMYPCVHGMDGWIDDGRVNPADSRG